VSKIPLLYSLSISISNRVNLSPLFGQKRGIYKVIDLSLKNLARKDENVFVSNLPEEIKSNISRKIKSFLWEIGEGGL